MPSIFGHESESFRINEEIFSYANEVQPYYSTTKSAGGCTKGNGQKLRISYIKANDENIILKIEELV